MQELDARSLHLMRAAQTKPPVQPIATELDALCEIGVRATGADVGVVTLVKGDQHCIVGRYGTDAQSFPRLAQNIFGDARTTVFLDMQNDPSLADHPVVDGRIDRVRSAIVIPMRVDGAIVGAAALASRRNDTLFRGVERDVLKKIAQAAEVAVLALPDLRDIAAAARQRG